MVKKFGYDILKTAIPGEEFWYEAVSSRVDESIDTSKNILDGTIEHPDKRLAWMLFPPIWPLRADLTQGTMRLLFGDSMSVIFCVLNDSTQELITIGNPHLEDGVPVNWWVAGEGHEIFERRHLKYGFKLKDAWKKGGKDLTKCGLRVLDILRDVRNERLPQFATAPFALCLLWSSGFVGILGEPSMFEVCGMIWDGVAAKRQYGLLDYWFAFVPWPSMVKTLLHMKRGDFILKFSGLLTGNRLALNCIEPAIKTFLQSIQEEANVDYDIWTDGFVEHWNEGWPWPQQSIRCTPPDIKKKKTYEKELFDFHYPGMNTEKGRFMTPEDLNMRMDEIMQGILLDITHETKPWSINPKDEIISIGWGRNTEIIKDIQL